MARIEIDRPEDEVKAITRTVLNRMGKIGSYYEWDHAIVAKTKSGFPRILWSYGERIDVLYNESEDGESTVVDVNGEREVSLNVTANPKQFEYQIVDFIQQWDDYYRENGDAEIEAASGTQRGGETAQNNQQQQRANTRNQTQRTSKAASHPNQLPSGSNSLVKILVFTMVTFFLLYLFMLASLPY